MRLYTLRELHAWCSVPYDQLEKHPARKVPFRLVKDSAGMGGIMARELVELVEHNSGGKRDPGHHPLRAELLVPALHRSGEPGER